MERREDGEKKMVNSRLITKIVYDGLCYNYTSLSIHVCIYLCCLGYGWVGYLSYRSFLCVFLKLVCYAHASRKPALTVTPHDSPSSIRLGTVTPHDSPSSIRLGTEVLEVHV